MTTNAVDIGRLSRHRADQGGGGLARLWGSERAEESRALLEPLVDGFESGRETPEYAEAVEFLSPG